MTGTLVRIAGPAAVARGLGAVGLNEIVLVGRERLIGEVIRIEGEDATLQVYEDTTGLELGEPAEPTGEPLTVELGPGLLGQVYDGVQRPLAQLAARAGDLLARGLTAPAVDRARRWRFEPAVRPGERIAGGQEIGTAREPGGAAEPVLAPPDAGGVVLEVGPRDAGPDDPVLQIEGGRLLALTHRWPVRRPRPARRRLDPGVPFLTGQRVLDCFFPLARGSAAIVPGGFGTGKTVLEQSLAKFAAADVVVYVGCGERGNEMAEVLDEFPRLEDPRTGGPLMNRTVLVVNTSNMPVAAREASIYTGVTIAEYYRDQGRSVALMIDSTSRWAEALREISSRLEEMPGEEGYPTYLASRLAQFYERAGRVETLGGAEGSVTLVGAVSPPGGDFSEPVTQASLRVASALWALSADLAHRRHFPAIDWTRSFTLDAPALAGWFEQKAGERWRGLRDEAMALLQRERELQEVAQLVGLESLQDEERLCIESARLLREGFLRQNAYHEVDQTCSPRKAAWMLDLTLSFHRTAAKAVKDGVPLRSILEARLDERFLRLGETPDDDLDAVGPALRGEVDAALSRLSAE
ncbi:V-type ATP synthase subunit A [Anaeromyxobacter paludicola]|uniref:V-type ATP synthase alpha chain n=1 Tax=Anaeromyxobacter paludicola TaxID=2918171 RepID=A0ABM7X8J5_9BACT|nr:V-type ATP synthase subunit A [Anaeromyxobacter paludicola]BDG08175.1 V-type ATP synthase alpha chain [Anaeromyxobacter paludicola]